MSAHTSTQTPVIAPETRARDVERLTRELARARDAAASVEGVRVERPGLAVQQPGVPAPPPAPAAPAAPALPAAEAPAAGTHTTTLPGGGQIQNGPDGTVITGPDGQRTEIRHQPNGTTIIHSPDGNEVVIGPNGIIRGGPGMTTTETAFPPPQNDIPREVVPIIGTIFGTIAATIVLFPIARAWARRMDRKAVPPSHDVTGRLDRIEQAIETIAIEVERVSEAQRYSAKLLTERLPDAATLRASATEGVR